MVDAGTIALIVALNVAAGAFLIARLQQEGLLDLDAMMLPLLGVACGMLQEHQFVLFSPNMVLPAEVAPAAVHVRSGKIASIHKMGAGSGAKAQEQFKHAVLQQTGAGLWLDVGNRTVSPGLVDTHVHFDEPGRTHWEGIDFGTRAAAAGGVTTCVDMPLNNMPPTITVAALRQKLQLIMAKASVDVGMWAGLVPENAHNSATLQALTDAGALGFKSFMSPAGTEFESINRTHVVAGMALKRLGMPLYIHSELVDPSLPQATGDPRKYETFLMTRPKAFEAAAVAMLLDVLRSDKQLAAQGFRVHIAHLGNADALPDLAAAKAEGLPLSVETTPHYLLWEQNDVADGATELKCMPPIGSAANRLGLREGVKAGIIDSIATDHSPSPPEMKMLQSGDFLKAWGGIAGLQYALPATFTALRQLEPALPLQQLLLLLSRVWSAAPAKLAGLHLRKGAISEGMDADFVVWQPDAAADTTQASLYHRHKVTPYANTSLQGRVELTFVRGQLVFNATAQPQVATQSCGGPLLHRDWKTAAQHVKAAGGWFGSSVRSA